MTDWHYDADLLTPRVDHFVTAFTEQDPMADAQLNIFLRNLVLLLTEGSHLKQYSGVPLLFRHGLVMAWLTDQNDRILIT